MDDCTQYVALGKFKNKKADIKFLVIDYLRSSGCSSKRLTKKHAVLEQTLNQSDGYSFVEVAEKETEGRKLNPTTTKKN
ncbi:MAG: hypothetical protein DRI84_06345 [Bacteroidetes bacterium]|nr:MAG: hypothetical protein DRI84_06345 [Bacteroidota bacterium]